MAKFSLPEEDSLGVKPKEMAWNKKNLKNIDSEIEKLSKLVKLNLNIKAIERVIQMILESILVVLIAFLIDFKFW